MENSIEITGEQEHITGMHRHAENEKNKLNRSGLYRAIHNYITMHWWLYHYLIVHKPNLLQCLLPLSPNWYANPWMLLQTKITAKMPQEKGLQNKHWKQQNLCAVPEFVTLTKLEKHNYQVQQIEEDEWITWERLLVWRDNWWSTNWVSISLLLLLVIYASPISPSSFPPISTFSTLVFNSPSTWSSIFLLTSKPWSSCAALSCAQLMRQSNANTDSDVLPGLLLVSLIFLSFRNPGSKIITTLRSLEKPKLGLVVWRTGMAGMMLSEDVETWSSAFQAR